METPHAFTSLGGKEFVPDGTEYKLKLGAAVAKPSEFMPITAFNPQQVFYQKQEPSCGANAGAFAAALIDEHSNQIYSPDYQWIDIKSFDGYALSDGTDMKSIFKSLKNGSIPYSMLPERTDLPLAQYSSVSRVTPAMKAEAANHTIAAYGFHDEPLSMDDLKSLIYVNKAVLVLIRLGDEFWTDKRGRNSWAEKDILPLRTPDTIISGHFIVLIGYDENYIYFANWWSKDWGRGGFGYFGENYLPQIFQVGTLVDSLDKVTIPPFKKDLYFGLTDPDVTNLQRYLNSHGYTVAAAGPGSPGHETDFYGHLTQEAVARLQKANGIYPTAGYFGALTRAWVTKNP